MKKLSFQQKITRNQQLVIRKQVFNALRGKAKPYSLEEARDLFKDLITTADKTLLFNKHIGKLFPLILDLVANGESIIYIEKELNLRKGYIDLWLQRRERLREEIHKARELRSSRALSDWRDEEDLDDPL